MDTERGGAGEPPWWPNPDEHPAVAPPPGQQAAWTPPLPAHAPAPPALPRHRRRPIGRLVLAAVLSAALATGLGLTVAHRYAARSGPESVVRAFFSALAGGDAPAALALAENPPRGPWLTSAVLRRQLQAAAITGITVLASTRRDATATVRVRYELHYPDGAQQVSDTVRLVRHGSSWRLGRVAGQVRVTAAPAELGRLRLAGRRLPAAAVTLFPGALPLAADPPALRAVTVSGDRPVVRLADPSLAARARLTIPPALRAQAEQALDRLLARCLAAGSRDPLCPLPGTGRPIPGTLHGTARPIVGGSARIVLQRGGSGLLSIRARLTVRGSWQAWDYQNQVVTRRGDATVDLIARVASSQPAQAFWGSS